MKHAARLLKIFSIAIPLSLGCATPCFKKLEKDGYFYDIDTDHKLCGKYKIISIEQSKYQWVADLPLSACNGFFAMSPRDTQRIKACAEEAARECGGK